MVVAQVWLDVDVSAGSDSSRYSRTGVRFTAMPPPRLTSLSPEVVGEEGGELVTVVGTGFRAISTMDGLGSGPYCKFGDGDAVARR